jgi:hypothetical protein
LLAILLGVALPVFSAEPQPLPWEREIPLREAAQSVVIKNRLDPKSPQPDWGCYPSGSAMTINNLKMRTTLWGPPHRVTISLTKNNVWDRRVNSRGLVAPTLEEITAGAFDPANKDYVGKHPETQRPRAYGYLLKGGGFYDPYREPIEYPMPCLKPVGQIILGMDALAGATAPVATQSCANAVVKLETVKDDAKASLEYVLGMTSNLYGVRGHFTGMSAPVWLRLYRHRDTAHLKYMNAAGEYTRPGTEKDKAFNFPMDPPTSGSDGRYFWIRQQMPPEKTFPQGFEYVLMGVVITPGQVDLKTVEGQTGLGTPPPDARIAAASGAAATATFTPGASGKLEALVVIVTTMEGPDVLALDKKRLASAAEAGGFDGVVKENMEWWNAFYDRRENGRIFKGLTGTQCTEDIVNIYRSYAPTVTAAAHTPTCASMSAAPPTCRRKRTRTSGAARRATTRSSPAAASSATGPTTKRCGSNWCGIGCPARSTMRKRCSACPAWRCSTATSRRSNPTGSSTPRSPSSCVSIPWPKPSSRCGTNGTTAGISNFSARNATRSCARWPSTTSKLGAASSSRPRRMPKESISSKSSRGATTPAAL